jgi:sporulation protein YlmC with PRC-barrel domain
MYILLDIDGVMIPAKGWKSPELLQDGFPDFSNKATGVLQQLISDDTTIILTTSHKSNFSIEQWKSIFKKRGVNIENLQCLPNNTHNLSRKTEILNWFNINAIKDFIIIDDDKSLNDLPIFLKENLIQPSPFIGLTNDHLSIANRIIQQNLQLS